MCLRLRNATVPGTVHDSHEFIHFIVTSWRKAISRRRSAFWIWFRLGPNLLSLQLNCAVQARFRFGEEILKAHTLLLTDLPAKRCAKSFFRLRLAKSFPSRLLPCDLRCGALQIPHTVASDLRDAAQAALA